MLAVLAHNSRDHYRFEPEKGDIHLFKRGFAKPLCIGVGAIIAVGILGSVRGSAAVRSSAPTFSGASNTQPAFDFMTQNFVQTANGGASVTFTFGGSGHLAGVMDSGDDYA